VTSLFPRYKAIVSFPILVMSFLLFGEGITPSFAQSVNVVLTTPDQTSLLAPQAPLTFASGTAHNCRSTSMTRFAIRSSKGVGGSFTDSSAYLVWTKLAPAQRYQLMNDLFNRQGIHLSFLRQPMGASDLALSSYTYDDLAPGETDPDQEQFSIAHDRAYILPTIRAAMGANPISRLWRCPGHLQHG